MNHTVLVSNHAQRGFQRLPADIRGRVTAGLLGLERNPRPPGSRKIKGRKNEWRIRVGSYRVIYSIDDRARRVYVLEIGPRRDVYDR